MTATLSLRRIARLVNGGTPTSSETHWGGDVPWATPIDLARVDGGYISVTDRTLTPAGLSQGSATVPEGSLVLSTRAPIGYVALAAQTIAFNQGCKGLVPTPVTDGRFLRYWLSASRDRLQAAGSGSTFMELSGEALKSFPVPTQPPDDQRRIADFLDDQVTRIDRLLNARILQAEALRKLRQSWQSGLLAGPDPTRVHPLVGPVDPTWPLRRLGQVVTRVGVGVVVNPSSYFEDEGVPFLHGGNVREGHINLTDVKQISAKNSAMLWRSRLAQGDVVVVRAGYPGRAAVVPPELDGANCASILLIRPAKPALARWIELFFNSSQGRAQVGLAQYGAAQEQINVGDVVDFLLPLPPLGVQREQLRQLDESSGQQRALLATVAAQAELLRELKWSLISAAVTGEFDVSSADGSRVPV